MSQQPRVNVLVMDGGGVRGLSTLIILQHLLSSINEALPKRGYRGDPLAPRDIFRFAAGTSTGGLIAMMLAVLDLNVDQCIQEFRDISKIIFRRKKFRGKWTGGLWTSRYRGTVLYGAVRSLLQKYEREPDELLIRSEDDGDDRRMHCAVVCREEEHEHNRIPYFKDSPIFLCSIDCGFTVHCKVCQAARATAAAMSYFKAMVIEGRFFSDGGFAYNNPSPKIYEHYTKPGEVLEARRYNGLADDNRISTDMSPVATHSQLDFSRCRLINIGTGTYHEGVTAKRNRDTWALFPNFRRRVMFYKQSLISYATSSEMAAKEMRTQVQIRKDALGGKALEYHRLSANNGLCWIKLDRHQELDQIEKLTREWLAQEQNRKYIGELAEAMAQDYMDVHSSQEAAANVGTRGPSMVIDTAAESHSRSVDRVGIPLASAGSEPPELDHQPCSATTENSERSRALLPLGSVLDQQLNIPEPGFSKPADINGYVRDPLTQSETYPHREQVQHHRLPPMSRSEPIPRSGLVRARSF